MRQINLNHTILFPVITAVLLVACATPKAVIRMKPVSENVTWNNGQAFAMDTIMGIMVEAAFEIATPDYNVFNVRVTNNSNLDYLVDPTLFSFENRTADTLNPIIIEAIDPETILLNIDKQISKNEADAKNARVGGAIVAGALIATSVALAVSDNNVHQHHYRKANPNLLVSTPILIDGSNNYYEGNYVSSVEQQRDMWANSTIRKTTLKPGYTIDGKLFFPRFASPGFYNLKVVVDENYLSIPFIQMNFFPN